MKAPINAALLLGALAALASGFDTRADLLPDAVEVPIAARDFQPEPSDAQRMQRDYDWALVAQMQRPDPLEQAHRAAQGV